MIPWNDPLRYNKVQDFVRKSLEHRNMSFVGQKRKRGRIRLGNKANILSLVPRLFKLNRQEAKPSGCNLWFDQHRTQHRPPSAFFSLGKKYFIPIIQISEKKLYSCKQPTNPTIFLANQ